MRYHHAFQHIAFLCLVLLVLMAAFSARGEEELKIIAGPYLHYPTGTTMTVGWETNLPATTEGGCGKKAADLAWISGK